MPNLIKYSGSNVTGTVRQGNAALGVNRLDYGPTSTSGFYEGITPPDAGWTIYKVATGGLSMVHCANTDAELTNFATKLSGSSITSVAAALVWAAGDANYLIVDRDYPNIVTDGMVLNLDAEFCASNVRTGTTWYDIGGSVGGNGGLANGVVVSNYAMQFDGVDDYVAIGNPLNQPNLTQEWTVCAFMNITSSGGPNYVIQGLNIGVSASWYGGPPLLYANSGANDYYIYGSSAIQGTGWHHLTWRFKNSTNLRTIYKNARNFTGGGPNNTSTPSGQAATWYIGQNMPGYISGLQVYNRVLTDTEVEQNYYKGNIYQTGLTVYYDFSNMVSYPKTSDTVYNLVDKDTINCTLRNGVGFYEQNSGILSLDGADDWLRMNTVVNTNSSNTTVSAWIKTTLYGRMGVVSNASGGPVNLGYSIYDGRLEYWNYDGAWQTNGGLARVNDGKWHHVTWVNEAGQMSFYIDGILDTSVGVSSTAGPLNIIGSLWGPGDGSYGNNQFNGQIAAVMIYKDSSLNADQVYQNYIETAYRFKEPTYVTEGLIMHWDPGDLRSYPGSGTTIYDISGHGNHGTLVNGVGYSSDAGGILTLDGSNDYVDAPSPNLTSTNYTVMGAGRYASIGGRLISARSNNWLIGLWSTTTGNYYAEGWVSSVAAGASDTSWRIWAATGDIGGDSYAVYINGSSTFTSIAGSQGPNGFSIGRYGPGNSEYSNSNLSALLVYDRVLTQAEVLQNTNYLRRRYGI